MCPWRRWGSNPRPLSLESSTLSLSQCALLNSIAPPTGMHYNHCVSRGQYKSWTTWYILIQLWIILQVMTNLLSMLAFRHWILINLHSPRFMQTKYSRTLVARTRLSRKPGVPWTRPSVYQFHYSFNVKIHPRLEQRWLELSNSKYGPQGVFYVKTLWWLEPNISFHESVTRFIKVHYYFHKRSVTMRISPLGYLTDERNAWSN